MVARQRVSVMRSRPASWASKFTSQGSFPVCGKPFPARRAVALEGHPQSFGNYFTYGTALSVLGVPTSTAFPDDSMRLAPNYCDFGYMWSQIGPPHSAMAALNAKIGPEEVASYPPDLTEELRDVVAEVKFRRRRDASFDVLGTEGAQGAIGYSFLTFLDPGDEVLITDPAYMHFGPGPEVAGASVATIPLCAANGFRLDPEEVEARLTSRTKMLVVCDPINPFGVVQTKAELIALARLCERRNIILLHNTTHSTHRTNPAAVHTPLASLYNETNVDHVISITGLSKGYGMAALRLGFMAGHPDLLRYAARVRMEVTGIHVPPFAQRAALAALRDQPYVEHATGVLRRNLRHLRGTLAQVSDVRLVVDPDYGFCTCLDVADSGASAQELTVALFKRGICVIAGDALGEIGATHYVRLNYSTPDIAKLERLRDALPIAIRDAQSGRYLEGIKAFYRNQQTPRAARILQALEARGAVVKSRAANERTPSNRVAAFREKIGRHPSKEQHAAPNGRRKMHHDLRSAAFLGQVAKSYLTYGPVAEITAFVAQARKAAQDYGVRITFGTFDELLKINLANQASWRPLIPTLDPRYSALAHGDSFCLLGYDGTGRVVATQACRLFKWPSASFHSAAEDLTLFYENPERDRLPGEECEVTAEAARNVRGRVAFPGAAWYHPDYRGGYLSYIMPRISRALAFSRWSTHYTASMIQDCVLAGGMAQRTGYTNISSDVRMRRSRLGDITWGFVWMDADQLIDDLRDFDRLLNTEINSRIQKRRA